RGEAGSGQVRQQRALARIEGSVYFSHGQRCAAAGLDPGGGPGGGLSSIPGAGRRRMRSYDVMEFGAPLQSVDKPTPAPQGSEVLLRTLATGVCHSDLHIWEGFYDLGGGKRLNTRDHGLVPPITLGHEITGEVVA